jgi:hypothetical protein
MHPHSPTYSRFGARCNERYGRDATYTGGVAGVALVGRMGWEGCA